MTNEKSHSIILFYRYVQIENPTVLMERERAVCEVLGLTGRVIIATEGINATLEGEKEAILRYRAHLLRDKRFRMIDVKETDSNGNAFPRLSIKVRPEIVTSQLPDELLNPRKETGTYLEPKELKQWFQRGEDFEIIDMRNDYEYAVGHFRGSRKSGMESFKDIAKVAPANTDIKHKKVVTVCTGGVRCEKASAYLKSQGFAEVYQLHGGIHRYMEQFPGEDFLGTLYTFDGRVTMDWGGEREMVGVCALCGVKAESYADCKEDTCGAHFIACASCRDGDGRACCTQHQNVHREVGVV